MQLGFIEPIKGERVTVTKAFCEPYEAVTTHQLFGVKTLHDKPTRGDFLGIGVVDDRGFQTYAQPSQLQPIEA